MKLFLSLLFCLCSLPVFAANPSLADFNLNQFATNNAAGNKVAIKVTSQQTNNYFYGSGQPGAHIDPFMVTNLGVVNPGNPSGTTNIPVFALITDTNGGGFIFLDSALKPNGTPYGAAWLWNCTHNGLSQPEALLTSDGNLALGWGIAMTGVANPNNARLLQLGINGFQHPAIYRYLDFQGADPGVNTNFYTGLVDQYQAVGTNPISGAVVQVGSGVDYSTGGNVRPSVNLMPFDSWGSGAFTFWNNFDIDNLNTTGPGYWQFGTFRKAMELFVATNKFAGGFHAYGRGIVDGAFTVGPVFDPTNVSGLVLYYDINKQNGLPNGVTTNLIADFSTNHFHLINGTAIYKQSAGSYQSNAFVTLNQTSFQTNFATTFSGTNTYFFVGQITNGNGIVQDGGNLGGGDGRNAVFSDGLGGLELYAGTTVDFGVYPSNSGALFVFRTGGNGSILTNMVSMGSPANVGTQGLHGYTLGSKFDGTGTASLNMAALYVYNKDVQGIEYTNICNALNERFRLHAPTDVNPQMIVNVPATFNQSVAVNGALQSTNSTFIGTFTNSAAFSYSNSWLTATNSRKTNIGQRGTWEVDFTFTDAVGGYPALKITVEDAAGGLTNAWTCQIPAGLAATSTNHYSFRVAPNGVVSVTNISTSTATADIVRSRMVWE